MICPQLASPTDLANAGRYVVDDNWVLEQKLDGHRIMLVGPGMPGLAAITRNGTLYTRTLPTAIHSFRLPPGTNGEKFVLDGELVGKQFWVFDMLFADGSLDDQPLRDRRVVLETFLRMWATPFNLVPQARATQEKEQLLMRAVSENLEGVIAKRVDSRYQHGQRPSTWLKLKFVQTADVVVIGVRDDGKDSAALGITTDGGASFTAIGRCSLIGKPAVSVGDVVVVRYLYVPDRAAPRLYQPTLIEVRTDKSVAECDGSDLKFTNKSVIASI